MHGVVPEYPSPRAHAASPRIDLLRTNTTTFLSRSNVRCKKHQKSQGSRGPGSSPHPAKDETTELNSPNCSAPILLHAIRTSSCRRYTG